MNAPTPANVLRPMPHVMNTYGRLPIAFSHGRGCRLWDTSGKEYLDALGGIAVNTLGHAHPKLVPALQDQVSKLMHCCNYYEIPLQEQLAAHLCALSGMESVFFCNSGLEANEAALKIAAATGLAHRMRVASALHSHAGIALMACAARLGSRNQSRRVRWFSLITACPHRRR